MTDQTCKWQRVKELIWQTECDHQIGTPKSWEPIEGMSCFCCHKPIEVVEEKEDDGHRESHN